MHRDVIDHAQPMEMSVSAVKKPDASTYVSRLVFNGKRPIPRDQALKTLEAAAQAIRKAQSRMKREAKADLKKEHA